MSYKCSICGKGPVAGKSVSHSKKRALRLFKPNLQKKHIIINGIKQHAYVCTGCLRTGVPI